MPGWADNGGDCDSNAEDSRTSRTQRSCHRARARTVPTETPNGCTCAFTTTERASLLKGTSPSLQFEGLGRRERANETSIATETTSRRTPGRSIDKYRPSDRRGLGSTRDRNVRSRCRCSMCPAIHINSRSWLRSSSTHEPSDPPLRVVFSVCTCAASSLTPRRAGLIPIRSWTVWSRRPRRETNRICK